MPRLERWVDCGQCILGYVFGHPDYEDGQEICTDTIIVLDILEQTVLTKDNITYKLGNPA